MGKESTCQGRRPKRREFSPWVGKIPWRRAWQPTPVFFLENPMDRGAWQATVHGFARVGHDLATKGSPLTVPYKKRNYTKMIFMIQMNTMV